MSDLIKAGEIRLFGTIVKDSWIWPEDTGLFSSEMVIDALAQMQGDVTLIINSDGGSPSEGEAIRAALEAHPGKVTAKVTGNAHSAASLMIMAADQIEMSAGSLMLIHDPSTFAGGNPAALTAAAAELDVMAGAYAGVYAARAGITPDAAREIMRAETMLTAPAAVEAGFADAVTAQPVQNASDPAMSRAAALVAAGAAMSRAAEAQMKFEANAQAGLETGESQNPGQEANEARKGETMSKDKTQTPAAVVPAAAALAAAALAAAPVMSAAEPVMSAADTLKAERARVAGITENAALLPDHVSQADVAQMIADGTPLEDANKKMISMAAAGAPRTQRARVHITRDESETKVEGIIGALMHKANPHMHKMEGAATDYRGLKLSTLAMHLAGQDRGFTTPDSDVVRAGLRSTVLMSGAMGVSDFAYITTEVMNRTLRAAYDRRPSTWRSISRQRTANDFRVLHSVSAGGDFELKPVSENGEYLQSAITDEAQGLKLAKYGRQITLTFEAIVNDDMGVFERIPGDFARAAGTLEAKLAWGAIRDNAKLSDTKSLFHADHKNIGTASAINIASVGEGRKKMWEQRPAGSKDKDAFIQVSPDLLFVPPALEVAAMQFVAATTATKTSDVNPFGSTLTPAVEPSLGAVAGGSDTAWYLFASDMPVLEHAYLDGYEAPTVMTKEGMNPDGVNMVARHIFAATPVEYRGAIKNAGQ
jgi:ATP-dependent protease ClpP protease subunit